MDRYQLGSNDKVIENKKGIISIKDMEDKEDALLIRASLKIPGMYGDKHKFISNDIRDLRELWLDDIYYLPRDYREDDILNDKHCTTLNFAPAKDIKKLMRELEENTLRIYTPPRPIGVDPLATSLAKVHVEYMKICPFSFGNERTGRLLAVAMARQAGVPVLDFGYMTGNNRQAYLDAVKQAKIVFYDPLIEIFKNVIK